MFFPYIIFEQLTRAESAGCACKVGVFHAGPAPFHSVARIIILILIIIIIIGYRY